MLKMIIVHGKNPMDKEDLEGKCTFLTTDEEEQHIVTLIGFLKDHYKDDPNLQQLKYTHPIQTAAYVFTRLGDIVFLDTSNKIKRGTFMMPEEMTSKQQEAFLGLKEVLKNYQDIRIDYDIVYDQGIFDSKTLRSNLENVTSVIDRYIDKIKEQKTY